MSFIDYATGNQVTGQTRVLIPTLKRRVEYQKYIERVDRKTGEVSTSFVGEPTHGWETVKEEATIAANEENMKAQYADSFEIIPKVVMVKVQPPPFVPYKDRA